ncbi:histone-like transcription factor [Pseudoscourfieldia marina]
MAEQLPRSSVGKICRESLLSARGGGGGGEEEEEKEGEEEEEELALSDLKIPQATVDLINAVSSEFITLLAEQANTHMEEASKKTMMPQHVYEALDALEFPNLVSAAQQGGKDAASQAKKLKEKRAAARPNTDGMTEEELADEQEELLRQARKRAFGDES